MPVFNITVPDGRTFIVDAENADIAEQDLFDALGINQDPMKSPDVPHRSYGEGLLGLGETALTMGSGMLATPVAGLAGLASLPFVGADKSADIVRSVQEAGTYQPRTEAGKEILGGIAKPFEALERGKTAIGEAVLNKTGSPLLATGAAIAPDVVGTLFGLSAFKTMKGGTVLKEGGVPTRELKDALNKHGIIYDELSPAAKQAIPDVAPRSLLGTSQAPKAVEQALVKDIQSGGRQQGLAKYSASQQEKLVSDQLANEAIRQQFSEGDVQMIKTSTPATQAKMLQMLKNRESIAANSANDIMLRPSNIVGDAAAERLRFIAEKSADARKELNSIADKTLRGKSFDTAPIEQTFMQSLSDLDVGFQMVGGKPTLNFKGSIIQADKASQRVLRDLADLMADSTKGAPDALRAHNLKRQIDALVDWQKTPGQGLTKSGEGVLKSVRRALNESLRASDPSYARVNDVISQSLQLFDQLDSATASKITVNKTLSDARGMGTELRKLFSNYQSRQDLDVAIKAMDDLAKKFASPSESRELGPYKGGPRVMTTPNFNDSIVDLARFANVLDDKFGTTAKTSFEGAGARAVKFGMKAAQGGFTQAAARGAGEKAIDALNRMRNIDDYNAYRSMEELLNRGAK